MQDADATGELDPIGRISRARGCRQRRRLREALGVRRQAGVPALRAAVRREQHPDDGVEPGRGVAVHRHERRRRRRQEGALHHRFRPRRQRRAPAERLYLGHGQLALQHLQRLPRALDAERRAARADRHRTARSGASRRTTTARCGSRAARAGCPSYFQFPIHYGNIPHPRSARARLRDSMGRGGRRGLSSRARVRFGAPS